MRNFSLNIGRIFWNSTIRFSRFINRNTASAVIIAILIFSLIALKGQEELRANSEAIKQGSDKIEQLAEKNSNLAQENKFLADRNIFYTKCIAFLIANFTDGEKPITITDIKKCELEAADESKRLNPNISEEEINENNTTTPSSEASPRQSPSGNNGNTPDEPDEPNPPEPSLLDTIIDTGTGLLNTIFGAWDGRR